MTDPLSEVTAALEELRGRLARVEAATGATADGAGPVPGAPGAAGGPGPAVPGAAGGSGPADGPGGAADGPGAAADGPGAAAGGPDGATAGGKGAAAGGPGAADAPQSDFWLLDGLARHTGPAFSRDGVTGSVIYGGHVTAPGVGELSWQMGHPAPDVAEADLDRAAQTLAALGHPFRLRLLRRLLLGASTLAELQEPTGQGTSGQVHHHLRELRSAGLVTSRRRNHYEIPPERVIPLLVMVAAALGLDLGTDDAGDGDDGDAATEG